MQAKEMTEVEHVEQLAHYVKELDLDKFTETPSGRRFGDYFSFKKGAPQDIVREYKDYWNTDYVARMTHPQASYLTQLLAKEYKVPIEVRSVDTAMEVHNVEKDAKERIQGWEHNREVILKLEDSLWVIPHPKVVSEEGKLVYDINGSIRNIVNVVRGRQKVEASEQNIDGGVKAEGDNVFDVLRNAGVLREHKVKTTGGGMYFDDSNYKGIASVGSYSYGGLFYAGADWPSIRDVLGLARSELLEKE